MATSDKLWTCIYRPHSETATPDRRGIWGALRAGNKAANPTLAWGVPVLLRAGYAVASLNYRFSHPEDA